MNFIELIGLLRDVAIIGFVLTACLLLIALVIIGLLLYRKLAPLLDATRKTADEAAEMAALVTNKFIKPVIEKSAFAYTTGKVVSFILGFAKRRGGK